MVEALTVYQPWASLIMMGWKPHEFRKWDFSAPRKIGPRFVKGRTDLVGRRIVLHASARPIRASEVLDLIQRIQAGESSVKADALPLLERLLEAHKCKGVLEIGAGIGTVIIGQPKPVGVLYAGTKFFDSDRLNHHLFGWPMSDPKSLPEPVPMPGLQGFWNWRAPVPQECC